MSQARCAAVFTPNIGTSRRPDRHSAALVHQAFASPEDFLASLPALKENLEIIDHLAKSRNGFALSAWQDGFNSKGASSTAKGKGRDCDVLEALVAGLEVTQNW